jgi:hypothetical protein
VTVSFEGHRRCGGTGRDDRFFVDKVATWLLVFEGDGQVADVQGNWTIWQMSREQPADR